MAADKLNKLGDLYKMLKKSSIILTFAMALGVGIFNVSANSNSLVGDVRQTEQTTDKMTGEKMAGDKMAGKKKHKKKHKKSGHKMTGEKMEGDKKP